MSSNTNEKIISLEEILKLNLLKKRFINQNEFILERDDIVYKQLDNDKKNPGKGLQLLTLLTIRLNNKYKLLPYFQSNIANSLNKYLANNVMLYWHISNNKYTDAKYIVYRLDYRNTNDTIKNIIYNNMKKMNIKTMFIIEPNLLQNRLKSEINNNQNVTIIESLIYIAMDVDLIIKLLDNIDIFNYINDNYYHIINHLLKRNVYIKNIFKLNKASKNLDAIHSFYMDEFKNLDNKKYNYLLNLELTESG